MTSRQRRHAERAVEHQVQAVRDELHAIIDRCIDDWRSISHLAGMALERRGDSAKVTTSDVSDPTLAAVLTSSEDPAQRWLDELERFRSAARILDAHRHDLAPAAPQRGRINTVDVCVRCGQPNPKMHRIDGEPHCATTCYYAAYRERRANAQTA